MVPTTPWRRWSGLRPWRPKKVSGTISHNRLPLRMTGDGATSADHEMPVSAAMLVAWPDFHARQPVSRSTWCSAVTTGCRVSLMIRIASGSLQCLYQALQRYGCRLHAYVLMDNHVHLLLTPDEAGGVSRMMHAFSRNYVGLFNGRHGRTGTLWEGRYKACLVDSGRYFLACSRYIELNPVRAWMVAEPGDHPWSSHGANAVGRVDPLLCAHPEYLALGPDPASGRPPIARCWRRRYRRRKSTRSAAIYSSRRRWARIRFSVLGSRQGPAGLQRCARFGRPPRRRNCP